MIYHNSFFLFICTFCFFSTVQIVPLLLSMCGVYSNLFITKDQVIQFFKIYPYDKSCYKEFIECLHPNKYIKRDRYNLKDFITSITSFTPTHNILESFRYEIVNKILTENIFLRMRSKIDYYYTTCEFIERPKNPETCTDRLYRVLCTTEPHPYHYNYYISTPSVADLELILYEIKQRYGYGLRDRSKSQMSFNRSSKSMKYNNFNNNVNTKDININTINQNYNNTMNNLGKNSNFSPTNHQHILKPTISCDDKYLRDLEHSRMNSDQNFEFDMINYQPSLSASSLFQPQQMQQQEQPPVPLKLIELNRFSTPIKSNRAKSTDLTMFKNISIRRGNTIQVSKKVYPMNSSSNDL